MHIIQWLCVVATTHFVVIDLTIIGRLNLQTWLIHVASHAETTIPNILDNAVAASATPAMTSSTNRSIQRFTYIFFMMTSDQCFSSYSSFATTVRVHVHTHALFVVVFIESLLSIIFIMKTTTF